MFEGLTKKLGQKKQKKNKYFPECQGQGTRGRGHLPRVLGLGSRGRAFPIFLNGSVYLRRQMHIFFFVCPSSPSVALGEDGLPRVPFFPECNSSPSATLGEDCLPRVPDFWHSGKYVALGEYCFSRSGSLLSIPRNVVISESGVVADSGNSWMVPVFVLDSQ
jgi:hypothetical protein